MVLMAQTVNVHFKNGQTINYPSDNVDYVDFSEKTPSPTLTAGAVVDLGLSVYWASCNLGAEKPDEYGGYYAWGEISPKNTYYENNYTYYNKETREYIDLGANICGTSYDAATVNLGKDWRMPTKSEMEELINKCTWTWGKHGDLYGFVVTGKNNNSIFLPAAGSKSGMASISKGSWLSYWTGSTSDSAKADYLDAKENAAMMTANRIYGYPIRPVTSNPNVGQ